MRRMTHGVRVSLEEFQAELDAVRRHQFALPAPIAAAAPRRLTDFNYLFQDLVLDDENLLPLGTETVRRLIRLGESMKEEDPSHPDGDAGIPAIYTYFGQFVDHDVTLELESDRFGFLDDPNPLPADEIVRLLKNMRTGVLDLDSVYASPAPISGDEMEVGFVSPQDNRPPGKDDFNDLPRAQAQDGMEQEAIDRVALIGDGRNDENLIISQLHLAFLRAHNTLVRQGGMGFEDARTTLRRLYQWVVIHDFLAEQVAQRDIVMDILRNGNRFFRPVPHEFFLPLEFVAAAYRFGHSMVRAEYDFNLNFGPNGNKGPGTLDLLFTFTALSGELGGHPTLPEDWIIQWERFVEGGSNQSRKLDTLLVEPLFMLKGNDGTTLPRPDMVTDAQGAPIPNEFGKDRRLAVRNLLRGYRLRIPTGQSVARAMGQQPLTPDEILAAAAPTQRTVLQETGFHRRTPLWFYVLVEAKHAQNGEKLGPVGSTIVAEVLIEMVRRSPDSILLLDGDWTPAQLGAEGDLTFPADFRLRDLLKLGGVLEDGAALQAAADHGRQTPVGVDGA